jgi:hypothetical protein
VGKTFFFVGKTIGKKGEKRGKSGRGDVLNITPEKSKRI